MRREGPESSTQIQNSEKDVDTSHRSITSPIFVVEILAEILSCTIYRPGPPGTSFRLPNSESSRNPSRADPPWPFLLVCRFWREVTLATPSLWATFVVALDNDPVRSEIAHLPSMLDTHLRLSRNEPLTLVIRWKSSSNGYSPENAPGTDPMIPLSELVHKAQDHQHRWSDVVMFPNALFNSEVVTPTPINFTLKFSEMNQLKHLTVGYYALSVGTRVIEFAPSPLLESLSLVGSPTFALPTPKNSSTMPTNPNYFPRLTTVTLDLEGMDIFSRTRFLLEYASNLECLKIDLNHFWHPPPPDPGVEIELPKLRNLIIRSLSHISNMLYFSSLRLLSLERLELEGAGLRVDSLLAAAFRHLPLVDLSLDFDEYNWLESYDEVHFVELLQSLGQLRHLHICNHRCSKRLGRYDRLAFVRDLTSALSSPSRPERILPHLVSLEFRTSVVGFLNENNANPSGGITLVKDLILACRRKYPTEFRFSVSYDTTFADSAELDGMLHSNAEILGCIAEGFEIMVNSVSLVPPTQRAHPVSPGYST